MNPASRNNVFAGLFLVATLSLAVWVTFKLSDRGTKGADTPIIFRFEIETGAYGLKEGSAVTLGGQRIGEVLATGFHSEPVEKPENLKRYIDVLARVRGDLGIGPAAAGNLDRPLLGSSSTINISMLGTGKPLPNWKGSELDPAAPVLRGTLSPPAVLQQAGFGPEQSRAIEQVVEDLRQTTHTIRAAVDENTPKFTRLVDSTNAVVSKFETKVPAWTERLDRVTDDSVKAAAEFPVITSKFSRQLDEFADIVNRNKEKIDSIVAKAEATMKNAESASAKVDRESIDALNAALRDSQQAIEKLQRPLAQIRDFVNEDLHQLKTTLANTRLMSEQLKLTATEVRSQPWRLLYRPDTRELQAQLVFDAARSYAQSVSDLRAAGESLAAAESLAKDAPSAEHLAHVQSLSAELKAALDRTRAAEELFMNKLSEK